MTISFLGSLPMVMEVFSRRNSLILVPLNWSINFAMCAILLQVLCLLGTDWLPRPLRKRPQSCGKLGDIWTRKWLPELCYASVRHRRSPGLFRFGCFDTASEVRRLLPGPWNGGVSVALLVGITLDLSTVPPQNLSW